MIILYQVFNTTWRLNICWRLLSLFTFSSNIVGSKRIFSVSFTRGKCIQERYQPFEFQTNESMSDCIYAKSLCSEEGQIVNNDDSTKNDRTCRCDYKNNYSFVKIPRHVCYCLPTEEDCSCNIKSCPVNSTLTTGILTTKLNSMLSVNIYIN